MPLNAKRRWPKFSVRTLLVAVMVFCVWLAWQVHVVHRRQAMLKTILLRGGGIDFENRNELRDRMLSPQLPLIRRMLGDEAVFLLRLNKPTKDEIALARERFPEVEVWVVEGPNPLSRHARLR
jgi:hypothetical protein